MKEIIHYFTKKGDLWLIDKKHDICIMNPYGKDILFFVHHPYIFKILVFITLGIPLFFATIIHEFQYFKKYGIPPNGRNVIIFRIYLLYIRMRNVLKQKAISLIKEIKWKQ